MTRETCGFSKLSPEKDDFCEQCLAQKDQGDNEDETAIGRLNCRSNYKRS